jgi:hypothetical protein
MAEHDFVDIFRRNRGVRQRFGGHLHDEALDRFTGKLAEGRMRPTHDAGGHGSSQIPAMPNFRRFSLALFLGLRINRHPRLRIPVFGFAFEPCWG